MIDAVVDYDVPKVVHECVINESKIISSDPIKKRAKNPDYLEKIAQIMSRCGSIYFDGQLSIMTQKEDALTISMSVAGEYLKCN